MTRTELLGRLAPLFLAACVLAPAAPSLAKGSFTQLYLFTGGADGADPLAAVTLDSTGNIYGEANQGGVLCAGLPNGCGTVYKIDPSGHETTLLTFTGNNGAEAQGQPLIAGSTLYASAYSGAGSSNCGTIVSVGTDGSNSALLHTFDYYHGCLPVGALLPAPGGKAIYGITSNGGRGRHQGDGVVFQLNTNGKFALLHAFHGPDGANPNALLIDRSGTLYGSTAAGGTNNDGVVFSLVPKTGIFTILHSFTGKQDQSIPQIGSIGPGGVLYGSTLPLNFYHRSQYGTLFSLASNGGSEPYTLLYTFNKKNNPESLYQEPRGGPQLTANGNLTGFLGAGLFLYDLKLPHNGVYFDAGAVDPYFTDAGHVTIWSGAVYGAASTGGGTVSTQFPYGAGSVFRWSPGSP